MRKFLIVLLSLTAVLAVAAFAAVHTGSRPAVGGCIDPLPTGAFQAYRTNAADGNCLQGYAWAPTEGAPRAVLVVVHGLGDHARRYGALAQALNAQGVAVLAQDHRGHAGSGGARQRIDSVEQAAADVELALREAARRWPGAPLVLHGHSTIAALLMGVDAVQPKFASLRQPLLVLHGGTDTVTPPAGSRALHERAASAEKALRLYEAARHDLLHEPEAGQVTQEIVAFVTRRMR